MKLMTVIFIACGVLSAEPMRRLTHSQYNNAVRDLLGDQTRPADRFPPEDFNNGFRNQVQTQSISPLLAESYSVAAERLARNAFRGGDPNHLVPCRPNSATDRDCAAQFVSKFGRRAYRRPLTPRESERLVTLLLKEADTTHDFYRGAQAVVEAMLQSPHFLHRVEKPGSAYSVASRLAFLLWDTIPDEPLLDAAARHELATPEAAEKMARRMIDDPRSRAALDEFLSQWLRFDLLLGAVKDRRLYPQFTPELAAAMAEETRLLTHDLVFNNRNFMEFFTAEYGYLNSDLASIYQFPAPPAEFAKVQFPTGIDRAGILGQGSFLALTSKPGDTSPTIRGVFVREHFLCQGIPDPPPGTNSTLPEVTASKPRANRDRLEEHRSSPACMACHSLIDPVGYGFEKFDAIGRRRDKLKLTFLPLPGRENKSPKPTTAEVELDTRGAVQGIPNSDFSSPKELGNILAASTRCQDCIVKQYFRYAAGRRENSDDEHAINRAVQAFRGSGFRFRELMISIAGSLSVERVRDVKVETAN
ncbi:MAG: DUF1592 domain-containing protein [Bryobacterales bacterium]|nr:DUF1592 domain-containing protein [Bryobacterales bacterium]